MAQASKKDSSPSLPAKPKPVKEQKIPQVTIKELVQKHNDLTLKVTFLEAVLELSRENFGQHDGLEPKNMVITSDGRRVPEVMIESLLTQIEKALLQPLQQELQKLDAKKV